MNEPDAAMKWSTWSESDEPRSAIQFTINGEDVRATVPDRLLLSDFLRDYLGLTALKVGCGEGACGACTVIIDGEPARTCIQLALQADGSEILTLEGLNLPEGLDQVQQLFQQSHALQCGYCTPGLLITVYSMINRKIDPEGKEVGQYLSGHLCRCTGYRNIWTAVRRALAAQNENEEDMSAKE